jgi:hypothetical protein
MRADKEKAIQLRRRGLSYKRINQELGVPLATLAGWFKNQPWSDEIKDRLSIEVSLSNPKALKLMSHANRERWRLKHEEYRQSAVREFQKLKKDPLFLAGIMLYWGEGDKVLKNSSVRLTNTDPEMIKTFNLFLLKILNVSPDRIHARLLLYPDLIESVQKNIWTKMTGLSLNQFKKSAYIKGRHPTKRMSYGVCTITINSRALKEKILKWLSLYQDHLKAHADSIENIG